MDIIQFLDELLSTKRILTKKQYEKLVGEKITDYDYKTYLEIKKELGLTVDI